MMRWGFLSLIILSTIACTAFPQGVLPESELTSQAGSSLSSPLLWGQRLKHNVGPGIVTEVKINGEPTSYFQQVGQTIYFDLTNESAFPAALPNTLAEYTNRGAASVEFHRASGIISKTYYPEHGAIASGEINVLLDALAENCLTDLENLASTHNLSLVSNGKSYADGVEGQSYCFGTFDIGAQGTQDALNQVGGVASVLAVSKNFIFGMDGGAESFDPGCSVTKNWLDPIGGGFEEIDETTLLSQVLPPGGASANGSGVDIVVIGGGIHKQHLTLPAQVQNGWNYLNGTSQTADFFACDYDDDGVLDPGEVRGHDSHIAEIISTIAPDAEIVPLKVCDSSGDCPGGRIIQALMDTLNKAATNPDIVVNLSLGGSRTGPIEETILSALRDRGILVVTSAGNTNKGPHYPAGYSLNGSGSVSLVNVVSVAAAGFSAGGTWEDPVFNTDNNFDLYAPAVNLCLPTVDGYGLRCNGGEPGISGTSYAAPVVTGTAALFMEAHPNANAAALRALLMSNAQTLSSLPADMVRFP